MPRLSGPIRRQIFSLLEVLPPGAFAARLEGDRVVLEGGVDHGVRRGDLFLLSSVEATRVCEVEDLEPTQATLRPRGAAVTIPPGTFAMPLHLQGHGGVSLEGPDSLTRPLAIALRRAHWEVWSTDRRTHAVATLHCTEGTIALRDRTGELCATLALEETERCVERLHRLARAARLQHLGGGGLTSLSLRATWGRVRDGACEPLPSRGAVLDAATAIFVRLENASHQRRFVSVFWLADDGEAALLSRSESMGIEVLARTTYILGARPFARAPRGLTLPRRPLEPGERRHERLVIVATPHRHALWSFESARAGRAVTRCAHATFVEILQFTATSSELAAPP